VAETPSAGIANVEVAVSKVQNAFRPTADGYFMALLGPAWNGVGQCCNKKLCLVATDHALLADVLLQLAQRPDCHYVKYSVYPRDGMYLGRCFLMDENAVGQLWAELKPHPRLMCCVQDDDFTAAFRPPD
jgi:hypothetical protein